MALVKPATQKLSVIQRQLCDGDLSTSATISDSGDLELDRNDQPYPDQRNVHIG